MVSTIVYFMTAGVGSPLVEYDTGHTASSELPCLEFPTFFWSQDGEETGNRCGSLGSKCALKSLFNSPYRKPSYMVSHTHVAGNIHGTMVPLPARGPAK